MLYFMAACLKQLTAAGGEVHEMHNGAAQSQDAPQITYSKLKRASHVNWLILLETKISIQKSWVLDALHRNTVLVGQYTTGLQRVRHNSLVEVAHPHRSASTPLCEHLDLTRERHCEKLTCRVQNFIAGSLRNNANHQHGLIQSRVHIITHRLSRLPPIHQHLRSCTARRI